MRRKEEKEGAGREERNSRGKNNKKKVENKKKIEEFYHIHKTVQRKRK
jgi:hypothetical protein